MKLKSAILLYLFQSRWSILVYYVVILFVFTLNVLSVWFVASESVSVNGTEFSTGVFLFITGVLFMKIQFPFFLQNGLSRRTTFVSSLATAGLLSAGMTIVTQIIAMFVQVFFSNVSTTFFGIYQQRYAFHYNPPAFFEGLVWNFALNLMCMAIGLFVSAMMYRLNRILKTVVWAGFGALVIFLPAIDIALTRGQIIQFLGRALFFCMGLQEGTCNPYYAVITFLIIALLFAGGQYLFLRHATVKK